MSWIEDKVKYSVYVQSMVERNRVELNVIPIESYQDFIKRIRRTPTPNNGEEE